MRKSETFIALGLLVVFLGVSVLAMNSFSLFKNYQNFQLSPPDCTEDQCRAGNDCIDSGDTRPNNICKVCVSGEWEDDIDCSGEIT